MKGRRKPLDRSQTYSLFDRQYISFLLAFYRSIDFQSRVQRQPTHSCLYFHSWGSWGLWKSKALPKITLGSSCKNPTGPCVYQRLASPHQRIPGLLLLTIGWDTWHNCNIILKGILSNEVILIPLKSQGQQSEMLSEALFLFGCITVNVFHKDSKHNFWKMFS